MNLIRSSLSRSHRLLFTLLAATISVSAFAASPQQTPPPTDPPPVNPTAPPGTPTTPDAPGTIPAAPVPAPKTAYELGLDAYKNNDFPTAQQKMTESIQALPEGKNRGDAEAILGYLMVRDGDVAGGTPHLEKAIELRPDLPDSYINLGNALLRKTDATSADTERAQTLLEKAVMLSPGAAAAQISLGYAYSRAGKYDKAAESYRTATTLAPNDVQVWISLGAALRHLKKDEEASEAFRHAATLDPDKHITEIWANLGQIEFELTKNTEAMADLETARKLTDSKSLGVMVSLANSYALAGKYSEAGEAYGIAADLSEAQGKPDAGLRYNEGVALGRAGKSDEANAVYDKILQSNPRHFEALLNSGYILFKKDRFDEAITRFQTATQVDTSNPPNIVVWKNLAAAYAKKKDWPNVAVAWRKVMELDPKNYAAREFLANSLINANKLTEVPPILTEMASLRPQDADPLILLGQVYQRQSEATSTSLGKQKALVYAMYAYQDALKRDPQNAPAWNNLGVVRERRGEIPEAILAYKKAVQIDPTLIDARKNLGRFKNSPLFKSASSGKASTKTNTTTVAR